METKRKETRGRAASEGQLRVHLLQVQRVAGVSRHFNWATALNRSVGCQVQWELWLLLVFGLAAFQVRRSLAHWEA